MTLSNTGEGPVDELALKITDCVERALCRYGSSADKVVIWNFINTFKLIKTDILKYPDKFSDSLRTMFGAGSIVIESVFVQEIKSTFDTLDDTDSKELVAVIRTVRAECRK